MFDIHQLKTRDKKNCILTPTSFLDSTPEFKKFLNFLDIVKEKHSNMNLEDTKSIRESVKVKIPSINNLEEMSCLYQKCFLMRKRKRKTSQTKKIKWNLDKIIVFVWIISEYSYIHQLPPNLFREKEWKLISSLIPNLKCEQCKYKWCGIQKCSAQKDKWKKEEDETLISLINSSKYKEIYQSKKSYKWTEIASQLNEKKIGALRLGKHCRERWLNHLDPSILRKQWSYEEDISLLEKIVEFGKKWSKISKLLKGRHENAVKNRYISIIRSLRKTEKAYIFSDINNVLEIYKNQHNEMKEGKFESNTMELDSKCNKKGKLEKFRRVFNIKTVERENLEKLKLQTKTENSAEIKLENPIEDKKTMIISKNSAAFQEFSHSSDQNLPLFPSNMPLFNQSNYWSDFNSNWSFPQLSEFQRVLTQNYILSHQINQTSLMNEGVMGLMHPFFQGNNDILNITNLIAQRQVNEFFNNYFESQKQEEFSNLFNLKK